MLYHVSIKKRAAEELTKKVKEAELEDIALKYCREKERNEVLEKEVREMRKELSLRKYTTRNGFQSLKTMRYKEFLVSELPGNMQLHPSLLKDTKIKLGSGGFGLVTIGNLTHLGIDVAIKSSKGTSQDVEGRVYQAFSGSKHFLQYFGISISSALFWT